jgi:hypothetical protein
VCLCAVDDPVNDAPTAIGPPPKQDGGQLKLHQVTFA